MLAHLLSPLARRLDTKNAILLALGIYTAVSIWGFFMATAVEFWLLAMMVGLAQGGSQALSRSLFGNMVPKAQTAEFYGFYDMSSKFAGLLGPLLFWVVGLLFGTSRLSIVSLIVFFVVGGLVLSKVNEEEGVRVARGGRAGCRLVSRQGVAFLQGWPANDSRPRMRKTPLMTSRDGMRHSRKAGRADDSWPRMREDAVNDFTGRNA